MCDQATRPAALLVVDDEEGMRDTLADILEEIGFSVDQAQHGRAAVDSTLAKRYDVVIMDVRMPVMDGIEALALMRAHDPALKVIMMTAYANAQDMGRVADQADAVMSKPLDMAKLLRFIEDVLAQRAVTP